MYRYYTPIPQVLWRPAEIEVRQAAPSGAASYECGMRNAECGPVSLSTVAGGTTSYRRPSATARRVSACEGRLRSRDFSRPSYLPVTGFAGCESRPMPPAPRRCFAQTDRRCVLLSRCPPWPASIPQVPVGHQQGQSPCFAPAGSA